MSKRWLVGVVVAVVVAVVACGALIAVLAYERTQREQAITKSIDHVKSIVTLMTMKAQTAKAFSPSDLEKLDGYTRPLAPLRYAPVFDQLGRPLIADLSLDGGIIVGFTTGRVKWFPSSDPIYPKLRAAFVKE